MTQDDAKAIENAEKYPKNERDKGGTATLSDDRVNYPQTINMIRTSYRTWLSLDISASVLLERIRQRVNQIGCDQGSLPDRLCRNVACKSMQVNSEATGLEQVQSLADQ